MTGVLRKGFVMKTNKKNRERNKNDIQIKIQSLERENTNLKLLLSISKTLNSHLDINRVIESILYAVMGQMKVFGTAVFTKKAFDDKFFILHKNCSGFEKLQNEKYKIDIDNPLAEFLCKENRCIMPEEICSLFGHLPMIKKLLAMKPSLFVPLKAKETLEGILILGSRIVNEDYTKNDCALMTDIASFAAAAINNARLIEMTTMDIMTKLKQKHFFFTILSEKIEVLKEPETFSVLMIDIDFFKNINDTYGHACGDIVLQYVAQILKTCVRDSDMTARYGGEEFVVALFDMRAQEAKNVADRILKKISDSAIKAEGKIIRVTVSIGVAEYIHGADDAKKVVERADMAMYQSKQNGRNRISLA